MDRAKEKRYELLLLEDQLMREKKSGNIFADFRKLHLAMYNVGVYVCICVQYVLYVYVVLMHICMYVCMPVCMYLCMYVYIIIILYVCILNVYVHTYVYTCMYVSR